MDACAVAGLAVRVHSAAMPDRFQRFDAAFDHLTAGFAVDGDDKADAAGRMLIRFAVHALGFKFGAGGFVGFGPGGVEFGHEASPSR